jgi:hypothetical protein
LTASNRRPIVRQVNSHVLRRSLLGVLQVGIVLVAVAVAVLRFAAIDAGSQSASDTLRPWLIQLALIGLVAAAAVLVLRRLTPRDAH